jgi:hypothetical protein
MNKKFAITLGVFGGIFVCLIGLVFYMLVQQRGGLTVCGLETCHGLNVECGSQPAQMCTEMYMLGDKCLGFAQCGIVDGKCQQIENVQFTACKTCVEACNAQFPNDPEGALQCENDC